MSKNILAIPAEYPQLKVFARVNEFSWVSELHHLTSGKILNICWWPLFKFHQRWFTQSDFILSCNELPGFSKLWKTIQKGSFAYNTLFLELNPVQRPPTDIADITTLALFFGDEFIDGLCITAGKEIIREIIDNNPRKFYLEVKKDNNKVELEYGFDLTTVLPPEILQQVNKKYGISYQEFYEVLRRFLRLLNKMLGCLPAAKAEITAYKISEACNVCLKTFLHDVDTTPFGGRIRDVATVIRFHESKTAYMQKKLLDLRCVLADKEYEANNIQAAGWLDIMRVVQIYDDIQDIVIDDGLQDNIALSAAFHDFPAEWEWFCANKHLLEKEDRTSLLLSLYMPCTIAHCMCLASEKISTMNWEQQKIMHYLLFRHKYVLYDKTKGDRNDKNFLRYLHNKIKDKMPQLSVEAIKSFAIDTCIHLPHVRKKLLRKAGFLQSYQLRYNLLSLSVKTKATIFDSLIK